MNRSEVQELLTRAVACEAFPRDVTETDVLAWHDLLRDLRFEDAVGAVRHHYAHSSKRLTPADVRRFVADVRAGRIARALDEAPPDPDDVPGYIRALAERKRLLGDGEPVPARLAASAPPPPAITQRPERSVGPLLIRCPFCGAARREPCRSATGKRLTGHHPSRVEAAEEQETA